MFSSRKCYHFLWPESIKKNKKEKNKREENRKRRKKEIEREGRKIENVSGRKRKDRVVGLIREKM